MVHDYALAQLIKVKVNLRSNIERTRTNIDTLLEELGKATSQLKSYNKELINLDNSIKLIENHKE